MDTSHILALLVALAMWAIILGGKLSSKPEKGGDNA